MTKDYQWTQEDCTPEIDDEAQRAGEAAAEQGYLYCPTCETSQAPRFTNCLKCGGKMITRKSREEIDALKKNWKHDPCWDIASTEGFEGYKEELQKYQDDMEAAWQKKIAARLFLRSVELGCSQRTVSYIEGLEARIARLEKDLKE